MGQAQTPVCRWPIDKADWPILALLWANTCRHAARRHDADFIRRVEHRIGDDLCAFTRFLYCPVGKKRPECSAVCCSKKKCLEWSDFYSNGLRTHRAFEPVASFSAHEIGRA